MPKHADKRGMLFDRENVLAILSGRKWQTRRLVRPANSLIDGRVGGLCRYGKKEIFKIPEFLGDAVVGARVSPAGYPGPYLKCRLNYDDTVHRVYCHIQPGDELWVQESFMAPTRDSVILYGADCSLELWRAVGAMYIPAGEMTEKYSRIRLKVTAVRVERLLDISPDDALAEGYPMPSSGYAHTPANRDMAQLQFLRGKWAKRHVAANPWVWVTEFKRVDKLPEGSVVGGFPCKDFSGGE